MEKWAERRSTEERRSGGRLSWCMEKVLWSHDTNKMVATSFWVDGFTRKLVHYEDGGCNQRAVFDPDLFQSARRCTFQQDRDPRKQRFSVELEGASQTSPVQSHGQTGRPLFTCATHHLKKLEQVASRNTWPQRFTGFFCHSQQKSTSLWWWAWSVTRVFVCGVYFRFLKHTYN